MTSRMPAQKPKPPKTSISQGDVCSQRSIKKPMAPPTTIAPTKVNGNSRARAGCDARSTDFFGPSAGEEVSSCLLSEGILGEPRERLRIQPGGEGDKCRDGKGKGLGAGHDGTGGFAGLLEPGVHDDAEVIVERGDDVEDGKDGEHRMVRFDEREENEILAHEASRRRNPGERKHEDEQQNGGRGTALIETVQVLEFLADESFLAKHDDNGEGAYGHEHVGEQIVGDSRRSGSRQSSNAFVPRKEAEQDVAYV